MVACSTEAVPAAEPEVRDLQRVLSIAALSVIVMIMPSGTPAPQHHDEQATGQQGGQHQQGDPAARRSRYARSKNPTSGTACAVTTGTRATTSPSTRTTAVPARAPAVRGLEHVLGADADDGLLAAADDPAHVARATIDGVLLAVLDLGLAEDLLPRSSVARRYWPRP